MSRRAARSLFATALGVALLLTGCSGGSPADPEAVPPAGPPPTAPSRPLPAGCAEVITDPARATAAVQQVRPGGTVCLSGDGLADTDLVLRTSGTPGQPVTVVGDGATVRSLDVEADNVVVDGLSFFDGDGLTLQGRGVVARNNTVHNATADGIVCLDCVDATIESNVVTRADGTGIYITGERVTVRDNTISESVRRTQGDADGIRFFGPGHRLIGNTIKDIKASGYGDDPRGGPHTDCFQTYNTADDPPTVDVVIADNICTNVDVQCLIATAESDVPARVPPGTTAITFVNNTCEVNGSQAVLLENFPHVVVRDNRFSGPGYRAVKVSRGSTDSVVVDNTVSPGLRPYEIDQSSDPGFRESGNVTR